ncbi:DNA binding domain, excisionase family [Thermoanaerobacter sp. YS13]|uniref:helix-turn-helix domain-containing protein n=1 Tax=Thermoanaerobacter sp. YS13 TaxID=1511746 RepID=UPI00057541FA|nr:helix-turn-helix domain-containing protein [Thermoanaerobacter sp. YS13]KHO63391.1 DNA binding domain, excisionase family [Thermoanaerobacter sp. YS13]
MKKLTVKQAIEQFFNNTISQEMLYKLVRQKKIPCVRIGKRILFDETTLQQWWQEQQEQSAKGMRKIAE